MIRGEVRDSSHLSDIPRRGTSTFMMSSRKTGDTNATLLTLSTKTSTHIIILPFFCKERLIEHAGGEDISATL